MINDRTGTYCTLPQRSKRKDPTVPLLEAIHMPVRLLLVCASSGLSARCNHCNDYKFVRSRVLHLEAREEGLRTFI